MQNILNIFFMFAMALLISLFPSIYLKTVLKYSNKNLYHKFNYKKIEEKIVLHTCFIYFFFYLFIMFTANSKNYFFIFLNKIITFFPFGFVRLNPFVNIIILLLILFLNIYTSKKIKNNFEFKIFLIVNPIILITFLDVYKYLILRFDVY